MAKNSCLGQTLKPIGQIRKCDTQNNDTQHNDIKSFCRVSSFRLSFMLSAVMLNVIILNDVVPTYIRNGLNKLECCIIRDWKCLLGTNSLAHWSNL